VPGGGCRLIGHAGYDAAGVLLPVEWCRACSDAVPRRSVAASTRRARVLFGLATLKDREAFMSQLLPYRTREWMVFAQAAIHWTAQVLAYLARYTHRVAIGNSRLVERLTSMVRFRWKRLSGEGRAKHKVRSSLSAIYAPLPDHVLPTASIAFATMAYSPTAAVWNSRFARNCSMSRASPKSPMQWAMPTKPKRQSNRRHAALSAG